MCERLHCCMPIVVPCSAIDSNVLTPSDHCSCPRMRLVHQRPPSEARPLNLKRGHQIVVLRDIASANVLGTTSTTCVKRRRMLVDKAGLWHKQGCVRKQLPTQSPDCRRRCRLHRYKISMRGVRTSCPPQKSVVVCCGANAAAVATGGHGKSAATGGHGTSIYPRLRPQAVGATSQAQSAPGEKSHVR